MTDTTMAGASLASEVIHGVHAIADELNITTRKAETLLRAGKLPAGKLGRTWISSRAALRQHMDKLINGSPTAA